MVVEVTHIGFSDESHWNESRYRSLALITLDKANLAELVAASRQLLAQSSLREFSWKELRSDNRRTAAERLCSFAVDYACKGKLRIDILIWDIQDSRHKIQGRDDTANLARMYYRLISHVIRNRWPSGSIWQLFVDERNDIDWQELESYLPSRPKRNRDQGQLLQRASQYYKPRVEQAVSANAPLVQIADLFAGLAAFSWNEHAAYERWKGQSDMFSLMFSDAKPSELSKSQTHKARTLLHFTTYCKPRIDISHKAGEGLRTPVPKSPINFWRYVPQHEKDKAPLRHQSSSDNRLRGYRRMG